MSNQSSKSLFISNIEVKLFKTEGKTTYEKITWEGKVSEFVRNNIIYGKNGSGKSTISRSLSEIKKTRDTIATNSTEQENIQVFSKKYINDNLSFNKIDNDEKPGIKLVEIGFGKEANNARQKIASIEAENNKLTEQKPDISKLSTNLAREISELLSPVDIRNEKKANKYRRFEKSNIIKEIEKNKECLDKTLEKNMSDTEIQAQIDKKHQEVSNQSADTINEFTPPK